MNLIKARLNDARLLFEWANDFEVRKNAINKDYIDWENHKLWLQNKLNSANTYIYIAEINNQPIGQIRFELTKDGYVIDYSIDKVKRGSGLGFVLLHEGVKKILLETKSTLKFMALVKTNNIASNISFIKNGFIIKGIKKISQVEYNIFELIL